MDHIECAPPLCGRHDPLAETAKFLLEYPDIKVEITVDYGLTDIVAQRYDAGKSRIIRPN
jgi:hypothetical protein